jgi:hypothetical protein
MKIRWLATLSPRRRRLLLWSVGLLLFYTITGFLIAPPLIRRVAAGQISKLLNRPVSIKSVRLNPYTMSASVRGFLISDKDGEPFVSWDEVYANFKFFSLFTRSFVFQECRVVHPYARVVVNSDYTLNFTDILEKLAREAAAQPVPPPHPGARGRGLRVESLKISGARFSATDRTTRNPFTKFIGPLELSVDHFATDPDNRTPYSFRGTTQEGERFSWSGYFSLEPIRSVGEFALENVSLTRYAPLYQDAVKFEIRGGTVDVRSSYLVEQGATTNLARLTNFTVVVRALELAEVGATNPVLQVPQFSLTGGDIDAFGRKAGIDTMTTQGGRIELRRNSDASINFIEMAKPQATNTAGSITLLLQSLTNMVELLRRSTNAWAGNIREISVDDYAIHLEDVSTARPVLLDLDQLNIAIRDVSNLPGSNLTMQVAARWNTNGHVRIESEVGLFPLQARVKLGLNDLEFRALDAYSDPFFNLRITQGRFGLDGEVVLKTQAGTNDLPDVKFRGGLSVKDLATVDGVLTEDFIRCEELRIDGIEAQLLPLSLAINSISLRDSTARLVIDSPQTNNLFAILRRTIGTTNDSASSTPAPVKSSKAPKLEIPTNLIAAVQASLPKITVTDVALTNVHLDFLDRSLKPDVKMSINELGGHITGLSSEDLSRADIQLHAKVGKNAPMDVKGKINLLGRDDFTDVKVTFHDIELLPTSGYSGRFLGYRVSKGKLSLDVHYELAAGKLKGQNVVTLDQLTLGEKVDSPDATKLPVKLALAILKDRSGKIELDVPVEGSLSDPEFRLGKVITRALVNVVTKIVTSPFAALGAVFGGKGEEVSYQDFEPGSSELRAANREKLDALVKGLYERPGLQIEIEAAVDAAADRDAIRRLKLQQRFRTKRWNEMRRSERARLTPEQVILTDEEYKNAVDEAWAALARATPPTASALTNETGSAAPKPSFTRTNAPPSSDGSIKGASLLTGKLSAVPLPAGQDKEAAVLESIEVTDTDFAMLASERARRVKDYILQSGQVEAERILIAEKPDDTKPAKGSRVYLHLR